MQHGHLHQHAIARLGDNDTAWPVEYAISDGDSAAYRQAVHKAAVTGRILEPGFIYTPVPKFELDLVLGAFVTLQPGNEAMPRQLSILSYSHI